MEQHEVERITRATLKDLGVASANITVTQDEPGTATYTIGTTVTQDQQPGQWRVQIEGAHVPLKIKCGQGSTAQWVRAQIFEQYLAQS